MNGVGEDYSTVSPNISLISRDFLFGLSANSSVSICYSFLVSVSLLISSVSNYCDYILGFIGWTCVSFLYFDHIPIRINNGKSTIIVLNILSHVIVI